MTERSLTQRAESMKLDILLADYHNHLAAAEGLLSVITLVADMARELERLRGGGLGE